MDQLSSVLSQIRDMVGSYNDKTDQDSKSFFNFFVEGVLLLVIGIFGAFGNLMCISSFCWKRNVRNFHRLMISTAVFELLYIVTAVTLFSVPHLAPR